MAKTSFRELLGTIANQELMITDVQFTETDQGDIIEVHLQPMEHPDVLSMIVRLPDEVVDQYDFGDAGQKWINGWNRLSEHLKKKGE